MTDVIVDDRAHSPSGTDAWGVRTDPRPAPRRDKRGLLARLRRLQGDRPVAMEDHGWFGPGSVARRVWSYPTALTVGFSRSVVVEELDPFLMAPVKVSSKIYSQTPVRYDRTLRYFATCLFGDSRSIAKASEVLMRVHHRVAAPDPVTGLLSDPNNPDEQQWIHLTAWHSILYTYEVYGPGRLTPDEEAQYWRECAVAAQAQTIDPTGLPRTRDEVRDYFARMRPRLVASEATQEAMDHLSRADAMYPPMPGLLKPPFLVFSWLMRRAVIATLPRYQRELAGFRQSRLVDAAIRPVMRVLFRIGDRSPRMKVAVVAMVSPSTVSVIAPFLLGIPPRSDEVLTPAASYRRHGVPTPAELYAELGHDQSQVIFPPSAPVPAEVAAAAAVVRA